MLGLAWLAVFASAAGIIAIERSDRAPGGHLLVLPLFLILALALADVGGLPVLPNFNGPP